MQVVNLGDNPKTHQLGRSSKGRQRYKVSYPAVSITGSELQSCSWPEAREPRDMSTNTIPSSAEGINSLALQLVLCALWGWGWGVGEWVVLVREVNGQHGCAVFSWFLV